MKDKSDVSIHKVWQFIKYAVVNPNPHQGLHFGSSDKIETLDLTNRDNLKFFLENKHTTVTNYKIVDSIITMKGSEGNIKFKIGKLTINELELIINPESDNNLIAMIFRAK